LLTKLKALFQTLTSPAKFEAWLQTGGKQVELKDLGSFREQPVQYVGKWFQNLYIDGMYPKGPDFFKTLNNPYKPFNPKAK
jgi:hypothetical protein